MNTPTLCEPGVKYILSCSLKESHKFKEKYMNYFFNVIMTVMFLSILFGTLWYRYKICDTHEQLEINKRKKHEYILSKLQQLSAIKNTSNHNMITNLPSWSDNPDVEMMKRHI